MGSKKVVLVIVEGPSDEMALEVILTRLFRPNNVVVDIVHGDITSDYNSRPSNIVTKVNDIIKSNMRRNRYKASDMQQVIHLMDTDGTFVPGDAIQEVPTARHVVYSPDQIMAPNKQDILERNSRKSANMVRLSNLPSISGIPYVAVYMSCNLDHALYNKLNSSDDDKRRDAFEFARKYRDDIPGFFRFITESDFAVMGERKSSWEYIRQDLHSLERHTNLGIFLPAPDNEEVGAQ